MPRPHREPGRPTRDPDLPSVVAAARAIVGHRAGGGGSDTTSSSRAANSRGLRAEVTARDGKRRDPGERTATLAVVAGGSRRQRGRVGELVAGDLDRDLHVLDLATVVAKYAGETMEHLDLVLRRAHRAGSVLLFDEADAIFGTRTEVRDSHDRHANLDVDHLLDRLRMVDSVVIVATREPPLPGDHRLRAFRPVIDLDAPGRLATTT